MKIQCGECGIIKQIDLFVRDVFCECGSQLLVAGSDRPLGNARRVEVYKPIPDLESAARSVSVQGVPYKITWVPEEGMPENVGIEVSSIDQPIKTVHSSGYIDFDRQNIEINQELPDITRRVTLLHEILHACLYQVKREDNEELIHALAYILLDVMRKNRLLFLSLIAGR